MSRKTNSGALSPRSVIQLRRSSANSPVKPECVPCPISEHGLERGDSVEDIAAFLYRDVEEMEAKIAELRAKSREEKSTGRPVGRGAGDARTKGLPFVKLQSGVQECHATKNSVPSLDRR